MSGHSKWSTIKHKKARTDAKRGKAFTKLIKEVVVAARAGGKDQDGNARLRAAVITARTANVPKDTIARAILRGAGEIEGAIYEELTYEGYGPGGVAFFIEVTTDNRNRTVAEFRALLTRAGGKLGNDGSVAWMFEKKGLIEIDGARDFDAVFEAAVEAGAEDAEPGEDGEPHAVYCEFTDLHTVAAALEANGFAVANAKGTRLTTNPTDISGALVDQIMALMETFDDHDDVQSVYTNAEISDDDLARLS